MRNGGHILIDQLEALSCNTIFCVPGESYLAALDGLYDSIKIQTIVCRHEGGASIMAEAYGKLTGRPGVCFVTRGPGAMHASIGVHIAGQDSTPMVLFVGLPSTTMKGREAFQEFDLNSVFGSLAKWTFELNETSRIPEIVNRAFLTAQAGRPGPVVIGLPENILSDRAHVLSVKASQIPEAQPGEMDIQKIQEALRNASRPLMLVGGPGWSPDVKRRIESFASEFDMPVAAAFRYQDYFDNRHECYVGDAGIAINPKLAELIQNSDLILAMGPRLGEMTTGGYKLIKPPHPNQFLIHVHPGAEELGSVYRANIPVQSSLRAFAARLSELEPPDSIPWSNWRKDARTAYKAHIKPQENAGAVRLGHIVKTLSDYLPEQAIITNGAGNYTAWLHRYFQYKQYRTQLAPTAGSMGYGLPAAITAKLLYPERPVIALAGDGCFMMTAQELATVAHYGLPIVIIVANNRMYGTIRMHQEREYPGRILGTSLTNPNFVEFAKSFGLSGTTIEQTKDFRPALKEALKAGKPALIELKLDPEMVSPRYSIAELRKMKSKV